jgi:hypothetical protein
VCWPRDVCMLIERSLQEVSAWTGRSLWVVSLCADLGGGLCGRRKESVTSGGGLCGSSVGDSEVSVQCLWGLFGGPL